MASGVMRRVLQVVSTRLVPVCLWASAALLAGTAVRVSGLWQAGVEAWRAAPRAAGSEATSSSLTPYTITMEEQWSKADGVQRRGVTSIVALRADGTMSQHLETLQARRPLSRRNIYFTLGDIVIADFVRERFAIEEAGRYRVNSQRDPATDCLYQRDGQKAHVDETIIGHESVMDYSVVKLSRGQGADGVVTEWLAPAVSCATLKYSVKWQGGGASESVATSIHVGNPPQDLFVIPNHFRKVDHEQLGRD